ncbi:hypothetical protein CEXT_386361 [Caerostris extrusa]|uniref:Uncharacterized protein n=1 Tax=Caerostris extrusa TaxID=172846 RepID=A0AAV4QJ78_CAEEX|nr:hypothetical protein CEXT_386361 [Caerostris extrusa]
MLSSSEQLKMCDKLLDSSHSLFESLVTCTVYPNLDEFLNSTFKMKYMFRHFQSPMLSSSEQLKMCDKIPGFFHTLFEESGYLRHLPNLDEFQFNIRPLGRNHRMSTPDD